MSRTPTAAWTYDLAGAPRTALVEASAFEGATHLGPVAGAAAAASYLLFALGALVDQIEPWRFLSPFQHAMGTDPILGGMRGGYVLAMVAVSLAVTTLAAPLLERRDIAV